MQSTLLLKEEAADKLVQSTSLLEAVRAARLPVRPIAVWFVIMIKNIAHHSIDSFIFKVQNGTLLIVVALIQHIYFNQGFLLNLPRTILAEGIFKPSAHTKTRIHDHQLPSNINHYHAAEMAYSI